MATKCLAVIPCRGGSKGVPRKNILDLGGLPLVVHSIKAAQESKFITRAIVSTDDEEISEVAKKYGGDVPFARPANLATDTARSVDVCVHVLNECIRAGEDYDYFVLLQPTTPLRSAKDIDATIQLLVDNPDYDCAITVKAVGPSHPNYLYIQANKANEMKPYISGNVEEKRRQEFEDVFVRNGAVYVVRSDFLLKQKALIAEKVMTHIMSEESSVNIDNEFDLYLARQIYAHYYQE